MMHRSRNMPNKAVHDTAAIAAGAIFTSCMACDQPKEHRLWELIGGLLAAWAGGRLPDIIDPPLHPRHRSVGHGALNAIAVGSWIFKNIADLQNTLRRKADEMALRR